MRLNWCWICFGSSATMTMTFGNYPISYWMKYRSTHLIKIPRWTLPHHRNLRMSSPISLPHHRMSSPTSLSAMRKSSTRGRIFKRSPCTIPTNAFPWVVTKASSLITRKRERDSMLWTGQCALLQISTPALSSTLCSRRSSKIPYI